ncbi:ABC transporter permease [Kytococcus sp. Marseille-QA3725]
MTEHEAAPTAGDDLASLRRLASSGRVPPPEEMARRARRWGWWYHVEYWSITAKAWAQSILVYAIAEPLLYLVAMGVGLGTLVDTGSGGVGGVEYIDFVAPALLVSTIVMSAAGEFTYPVMAGFKWERLFHGPHATPVAPRQIAEGHFAGVMLRFVVQAAIFLGIMAAFGAVHSPWAWLCVPIAVLSAAGFGAPLLAFAAGLESEGQEFTFIQRFVVMPMFLFAGTFYPLDSMPVWLQPIGWVSPIWHGSELARWATYGAEHGPVRAALHVGFLLVLAAAGLLLARRGFERRLNS